MMPENQGRWGALYLLWYGLSTLVHILIILLLIYTIYRFCGSVYEYSYQIFGPVVVEEAPGQDKVFLVDNGDSMWQVAGNLEQEGLIVNRYTFYLRTRLLDQEQTVLCAGEYMLNTSMDYEEIIDALTYDNYR